MAPAEGVMSNGMVYRGGRWHQIPNQPTTREKINGSPPINIDEKFKNAFHSVVNAGREKVRQDWQDVRSAGTAVRQAAGQHTVNTIRAAPAAAQRIIMQTPGAAKAGALAGIDFSAMASMFLARKSVKVTGTLAPLLIVVAVQIYDVRAGFPRGVGSFGAILAAYLTALVLFGLVWHFDLKQMLMAIGLQIFIPWLIQIVMFGFFIVPLLQYRQAMLWTMVLFTPMIWLVFSSTDLEKDFIMRHARTAYVICLCFLLMPTMVNWFVATLPAGAQTPLPTERSFKDIVDQTGTNMKKYFNAFPTFIDGILTGTQKNFENEPPPGSGDGLPQKIGLARGDEDIVVRFGSTQKASMVLHAESSDHSVYKFDTYCRFTKRDDKEKDIDDDGMVGLSEDTRGWMPTGDKLQFSGVRTIFCPKDPSTHDITYTDDTLTVQFGVKYAIPVVGSYTTYFIENRIENGVLVTSYNDATEFFTRNPALSPSLSKSTDAPCFMSIDNNNQLPPVGVQSDDPNFFVDVAIGYQVKDFYGTSVIDSINSLKVQVPDGVTDFVCEDDRTMFTKSVETVDGQQATFYTMSPTAGGFFHGKKLRIDCRAYVNKDALIWSGDYSQSTFLVNSTCNIFNTQNVNVKLIGFAKTGTGGAGGSFSQWPLEGPLTTCYGDVEEPSGNNVAKGSATWARWHDGIDIGVGGTVKAATPGTVDRVCYESGTSKGGSCADNVGYGNVVIIKGDNGIYTYYAHLADVNSDMAPGKKVAAGDVIGPAGTTGVSTGIHLHFGIANKDGRLTNIKAEESPSRNPFCYLPADTSRAKPNCAAPVNCPARAIGGDKIIPSGMPSSAQIARYEGSYSVSPSSYSSLKQLAETIGKRYNVEPAVIATVMTSESGVGEAAHTCAGVNKLTACGWPDSCAKDCSCNGPATLNDETQVECTAKAYADPTTLSAGSYDHCLGKSGDDYLICIACTYAGRTDQYQNSGTCDYVTNLYGPILAEWRNYYQSKASV